MEIQSPGDWGFESPLTALHSSNKKKRKIKNLDIPLSEKMNCTGAHVFPWISFPFVFDSPSFILILLSWCSLSTDSLLWNFIEWWWCWIESDERLIELRVTRGWLRMNCYYLMVLVNSLLISKRWRLKLWWLVDEWMWVCFEGEEGESVEFRWWMIQSSVEW